MKRSEKKRNAVEGDDDAIQEKMMKCQNQNVSLERMEFAQGVKGPRLNKVPGNRVLESP